MSLRSDPWPVEWGQRLERADRQRLDQLSAPSRTLGVVLLWAQTPLAPIQLAAAAGIPEPRLAARLRPLVEMGWVHGKRERGRRVFAYSGPPLTLDAFQMSDHRWAQRLEEQLQASDTPVPWALRLVFGAEGDPMEAVLSEIRLMRQNFQGATLLARLLALRSTFDRENMGLHPALATELALCRLLDGDPEGAEKAATELEAAGELTRSHLVWGHILSHRGDTASSAERFELAGEQALALLERSHGAFGRGEGDALEQLAEQALASPSTPAAVRGELASLLTLEKMRQGKLEQAREQMQTAWDGLERFAPGEDFWKPALWLTRGHLARQEGSPEEAMECYRASRDTAQALGNRQGFAAALGQLALVQREQGLLRQARENLEQALGMRQRSGDGDGALLIAGILSLVLLEQGCCWRARKWPTTARKNWRPGNGWSRRTG